jgi:regulator of sirC expression with transglutaminase-like and TPR domain
VSDIDQTTFEIEVRQAGDNLSPVRAGLLLARECAYPNLRPSQYLTQLEELGAEAQRHLEHGDTGEARGLGLAQFLFQTAGFRGNVADYDDPRNSYLNQVLERRLGLPITLSVIFLNLAAQSGVPASGIGLPGHFIVSILGDDGPIYLDPFNGGQRLSVADCAALVQLALGREANFDPVWLRPTPPRDIIARMLNNLRAFYSSVEDWPLAIRIVARLSALQPDVTTHVRDLGLMHYRNGALGRAAELLNEYLRRSPAASDADAVRQGRDRLREELARLN